MKEKKCMGAKCHGRLPIVFHVTMQWFTEEKEELAYCHNCLYGITTLICLRLSQPLPSEERQKLKRYMWQLQCIDGGNYNQKRHSKYQTIKEQR